MKSSIRFGQMRVELGVNSANPRVSGRVAQDAGEATAADGLVGLENPQDARKKRGVLVGLLVVLVGLLSAGVIESKLSSTQPYPDGQTLQGTVVRVDHHWSSSKSGRATLACTVEVAFILGNKAHTVSAAYSTGDQCGTRGQQVAVSVRGSDPGSARVIITSGHSALILGLFFAGFWVILGAWIVLAQFVSHRQRERSGL